MNNELKIFNNEDLKMKVRAINNEDGSISINAEDTAVGYGFIQSKNGKVYVRWETINKYCEELGFSQQVGKDDFIPESLFYMLGMKAKNETAREFQRWLAMEVIPSIRKTGSYQLEKKNVDIIQISDMTKFVDELKKTSTELGQYYKPTHKNKLDINKYIKKCLGINATKENCNRVKDLLLGRLGAETYQEIPIDVLNSKETFDKILDICIMISNNEGQIQMGLDL